MDRLSAFAALSAEFDGPIPPHRLAEIDATSMWDAEIARQQQDAAFWERAAARHDRNAGQWRERGRCDDAARCEASADHARAMARHHREQAAILVRCRDAANAEHNQEAA